VPSPFVSGFAQKRKEHPARTLAGCRHLSRISVVLNIRSLQNLSNCRVLSIVCSSCTPLLQGLPSFQSRIPRCWSGQSDFSTICTEAILRPITGKFISELHVGFVGARLKLLPYTHSPACIAPPFPSARPERGKSGTSQSVRCGHHTLHRRTLPLCRLAPHFASSCLIRAHVVRCLVRQSTLRQAGVILLMNCCCLKMPQGINSRRHAWPTYLEKTRLQCWRILGGCTWLGG